jgi:hypothetical protein
MSNIKYRIKFLYKIAQAVPASPATPTSPEAPASPKAPEAAKATTITLGEPPAFSASSRYNLRNGFPANVIAIIDKLCNYLNRAMYFASNGKYNMEKSYQQGFKSDATDIPSQNVELRHIIGFTKEVFDTLLNKGTAYTTLVNKENFLDKISTLLNSQHLNNLSRINPAGPLASKLADPKTFIISLLNNELKPLAPQK